MVLDRLCDLGEKRITEMDEAGIDVQVLSLSAPGVEQMEPSDAIAMARDTNDYLADAVKNHPTRFAGHAAVPTGAPKQAIQELERRVKEGFKGAVINGHNKGRLSRQPVLLAGLGMRRGAQRADLSAPDTAPANGDRRFLCAGSTDGDRHARGRRLGLAYGDIGI